MMRTTLQNSSVPLGDAVLNASRQVWLASLGAAVVTRDWAQTEAGAVFRTLVKEGTVVESRTIRVLGDRLEGSFAVANTMWKQASATVRNTVKQSAGTAVTLVQNNLPKSLPKVTLSPWRAPKSSRAVAPKKRATAAKRVVQTRATKAVRAPKRTAKAASKK
jgi:hypothetical protein